MNFEQVEAFNHYCRFNLKKKLEQFEARLGNGVVITLKNVVTDLFPLTKERRPRHVRDVLKMTGETFDVQVYADVCYSSSVIKKVELFKLPVLTGSIFDLFPDESNPGYFIINGSEHIPIMQERLAHNKLLKTSAYNIEVSCKSPNQSNVMSVRLQMDEKTKEVFWFDKHIIKKENKHKISVSLLLLFLDENIQIRDDYLLQSFVNTKRENIINDIYGAITNFKDLSLNEEEKKKCIIKLLKERFFIQVPELNNKLTFLLLMLHELFYAEISNRDSLEFKSYACINYYLDEMLNHYFLGSFKGNVIKHLNKLVLALIPKTFKTYSITPILQSFLATGNGLGGAVGLTQSVSRVSFISYFSQTQKLVVKQKEQVKITNMRLIDASYENFICSAQTPDGKSVGLVKHLCKLVEVSRYFPLEINATQDEEGMLLLIHGNPVGYYKKEDVVYNITELKKQGKINRGVTFTIHKAYIEINNTEGRLIRPFYHKNEVIYWDSNDEFLKTVDETSQYGYAASLIPFAHHNQAARNTYYSAQMLNQALGSPLSYFNLFKGNHYLKPYTIFYALNYLQKPLAFTKTQKLLKENENGTLIITCCKTHPFAQEDSVVISKGAIDRGLLRSDSYNTYSSICHPKKLHPSDWEKAPLIPNGYDRHHKKYTELLIHAPVGTRVMPGDIIVLPNTRVPLSSTAGFIEQVISHALEDDDGGIEIIITIRHKHVPQIGDKVTSQHAQKGTISMIVAEEDMPYSMETGMRAEMIVSPHAFPSRQTYGHQMVGLASKVTSVTGEYIDATSFKRNYPEEINEMLPRELRKEVMVDGETGMIIEGACYLEPVYYHILKHHSETKENARAEGPVDIITRQPMSGRSHNGGMKNGEMEIRCFTAHGADAFLRERTIVSSDHCSFLICTHCGRRLNTTKKACYCQHKSAKSIEGRYATRLLFDELQAFGIDQLYGERDF